MGIKIEYRGYEVHFGENSNEWWSSDFSVQDVDLGKVKAAMDKQLLKIRKASSVDGLIIEGEATAIPVKIVEYIRPITEKTGQFGLGEKKVVGHYVAIMGMFRGNSKPARREIRLSEIMIDCEDTHAEVEQCRRFTKEAKRLNALAKESLDGCPRVQLSGIETLVKVAGGDLPERED